ncbi:acyltransferase [Bradyrhizobium sp. 76]|uniref:acyltransferase family protein n=1 Tax=Bradyrhizobium sp. 76 TaxID=2782680 RepID=UPI001FFB372E|nr:acyltransferase [Bradyrhizobium sp. 76]
MEIRYPLAAVLTAILITYVAGVGAARLIYRVGFRPHAGKRIGCIDGLRGYLALSVLIHHFIIWVQLTRLGGGWSPPTVNLFNSLGSAAVALFFMVTGCLFYPIVQLGFRSTPWSAVYLKRLFRIMPLVMLSVMMVSVVVLLRSPVPNIALSDALRFAKWVTSWGEPDLFGYRDTGRINAYVLWSLWFEWVFYLALLPSCALAADYLRGKVPSLAVPILFLVVGLALRWADLAIAQFLPLFAIGMIAFEIQESAPTRLLKSNSAGLLAAIGMVVAANAWSFPYGVPALSLYAFFFICVVSGNTFFGLLSSPAAQVLGECSFGIYLLHGIILSVLFTDGSKLVALIPTPMLFGILPILSCFVVFVAAMVFRFAERPMIGLGGDIAKQLRSSVLLLRRGARPLS